VVTAMGACTVITDPDSAPGFRLAGVETLAAAGRADAERLLGERIAAGGPGVVLVSQELLEGCSEGMRRRLDRLGVPIVVPVPLGPAAWREGSGGDYVLDIIRRAIGFQVRIAGR